MKSLAITFGFTVILLLVIGAILVLDAKYGNPDVDVSPWP